MKDSVSISNLIAQCPAPELSNISVKILRYDARPPSVIFSQCGEGGHSSNRAAIIFGSYCRLASEDISNGGGSLVAKSVVLD